MTTLPINSIRDNLDKLRSSVENVTIEPFPIHQPVPQLAPLQCNLGQSVTPLSGCMDFLRKYGKYIVVVVAIAIIGYIYMKRKKVSMNNITNSFMAKPPQPIQFPPPPHPIATQQQQQKPVALPTQDPNFTML